MKNAILIVAMIAATALSNWEPQNLELPQSQTWEAPAKVESAAI